MEWLTSVAEKCDLPYTCLREMVSFYADRNDLVHNYVKHYIAIRDWSKLGVTLHTHKTKLKELLPGYLTDSEYKAIEHAIAGMENTYFESTGRWIPSDSFALRVSEILDHAYARSR